MKSTAYQAKRDLQSENQPVAVTIDNGEEITVQEALTALGRLPESKRLITYTELDGSAFIYHIETIY